MKDEDKILERGDYEEYWVKKSRVVMEEDYYKRLYKGHENLLKPDQGKIIDIGGGSGQFLEYLGIKDATVLDISKSGLEYAKRRGYETIMADARNRFPLKENTYSTAYCCEFLEHLHHPSKTLSEINNILKKDGLCVITMPNTKKMAGHVTRLKLEELASDLQKTGFYVVDVDIIPAFNRWDINFWKLKMQKGLGRKIVYAFAYLLTFIPTRVRELLARKWPNRFAMMFLIRCRKEIR